jgi:hypothetical protein
MKQGRAIAQAVSHWLPTAAGRVRSRVWSSGICGGQSGGGVSFPQVFRFPLPIFYSTKFSILTVTWGRYKKPISADVPSGPSLDSTPHYANYKKKKTNETILLKDGKIFLQ